MTAELTGLYPSPTIATEIVRVQQTPEISYRDQSRSQDDVEESVREIGSLVCLKTWEVSDRGGFHHVRHAAVMDSGPFRHALRISEPAVEIAPEHPTCMIHMPGFLEDPAKGTARNLHDDLAAEYPDRRVVSISSDGVNPNGSALTWDDIGYSFDGMALNRLAIARELSDGEDTVLIAVSMSSQILRIMTARNKFRGFIDHKISVVHSPAILEPHRILPDMILRFPPHMWGDSVKEAIMHPGYAVRALKGHHLRRKALPAYVIGLLNLFQGVPEYVAINQVADSKVGVIAGDKDPLAQWDLWRRLQAQYPDNVHLRVKPHRGHGLSLDSREAAQDIHEVENALRATPAIT